MLLVHIGKFDRFAHLKRAGIGRVETHDEAEERGFAHTIRTNDPHDAVGRQVEVKVGIEYFFAERLRHMLSLNDLVAQPRAVRNINFQICLLLLPIFS